MEAKIKIDDKNAPSLPDEAIVNNGDEHFIYVQKNKNQFRQVAVSIGASDSGFTEVVPAEQVGLDVMVVTKGAYYLLSQLTKGEGEHD